MQIGQIEPRGWHGLLYGPPGICKTSVAFQLPRPLLYLDIEGGSGWVDVADKQGADIKVLTAGESVTNAITTELLAAARLNNYASVVIDSLSNVRLRELDRVAGGVMPAQGDYGLFNAWLGRILTQSQYFPQITLWLATSEEQVDGQRRLLVPGGMSENNLALCNQVLDSIVYVGWKQKPGGMPTRYFTVAPTDPFGGRSAILTKDRTGLLMPNPTVEVETRQTGQPLPDMVSGFFQPAFDRALATMPGALPKRAVAPPTGQRPTAPTARPAAPVIRR